MSPRPGISERLRRVGLGLIAALIVAIGAAGAYGYGQAYSLHRGFAPIARLPGAGVSRVETVTFYSAALHRRADYVIALPAGYSARRRYPVMYLLHGAPGSPQAFTSILDLPVRLANLVSQHRAVPMILVFLDGRIGGAFHSDSQWANTRAGAYESYVVNAVTDVDHRFWTLATRRARIIAGYSAGAFAAMNVGLHHLATFGAIESWSGYYIETPTGVFAHAGAPALQDNSPLRYVSGLSATIAREPVRVFMYVGRLDSDRAQTRRMNRALLRAGALSSDRVYPGGHDWQLWTAHANAMLELASRWIAHPLPAPSAAAVNRARARAGAVAGAHTPTRAPQRAARGRLSPPRSGQVRPHRSHAARGLGASAILGLILALVSAGLINLGFLLQHRAVAANGPAAPRAGSPAATSEAAPGASRAVATTSRAVLTTSRAALTFWRAALTNRTWLAGQALGWFGFGVQIVAVALAPLSLVQAFAAGGLALSVPLASRLLGARITRAQSGAVLTMAIALAVLPLGLGHVTSTLHRGAMALACATALGGAMTLALTRSAAAQAIAAGLFYGAADAAIKALVLGLHHHGAGTLVSVWTLLLAAGTLAGFIAFQSALRTGSAICVISLMTALTTLTAMAFGLVAFGESLGTGAQAGGLHLIAIAVVLACVPVLAGAGHDAPGGAPRGGERARTLRAAVTSAVAAVWLVLAVVAGVGLLWLERGVPWPVAGPRLGDALPLLALAGQDAAPLAALALAWLAAGASLALVLIAIRPAVRGIGGAAGALVVLWLASDVSMAVARNLATSGIVAAHIPGAGVFAAAALFGLGAWAPRLPSAPRARRGARAAAPRITARLAARANRSAARAV